MHKLVVGQIHACYHPASGPTVPRVHPQHSHSAVWLQKTANQMPGLVRSMGPLSAQYTEDLHVFFPQSGYRSYKVRNIIEGHIKQAITIHVVGRPESTSYPDLTVPPSEL